MAKSYLSTFSRLYTQHTGRSLPRFQSAAHSKFNGTVKFMFGEILNDWEAFLLYVFLHNPLGVAGLEVYSGPEKLRLCIPAFKKFVADNRETVKTHGIQGAVTQAAGKRAVKGAESFLDRISGYQRLAEANRRSAAEDED